MTCPNCKHEWQEVIPLSPREQEIFNLVKAGKNNKDISKILNISLYTTKAHISNIYKKLNLKFTSGGMGKTERVKLVLKLNAEKP